MRYMVVVDGRIACAGETRGRLSPGPGEHVLEVPEGVDLGSLPGRPYVLPADPSAPFDAERVEPMPAPRRISLREFLRRFTDAEELALEALAEQSTPAGRAVRVLMRRLTSDPVVELDHPEVVVGFERLKAIAVPAVWADEATADARIAEIRA